MCEKKDKRNKLSFHSSFIVGCICYMFHHHSSFTSTRELKKNAYSSKNSKKNYFSDMQNRTKKKETLLGRVLFHKLLHKNSVELLCIYFSKHVMERNFKISLFFFNLSYYFRSLPCWIDGKIFRWKLNHLMLCSSRLSYFFKKKTLLHLILVVHRRIFSFSFIYFWISKCYFIIFTPFFISFLLFVEKSHIHSAWPGLKLNSNSIHFMSTNLTHCIVVISRQKFSTFHGWDFTTAFSLINDGFYLNFKCSTFYVYFQTINVGWDVELCKRGNLLFFCKIKMRF
jgi:hypothetical protein